MSPLLDLGSLRECDLQVNPQVKRERSGNV